MHTIVCTALLKGRQSNRCVYTSVTTRVCEHTHRRNALGHDIRMATSLGAGTCDPPASASQNAKILGVGHHTQLEEWWIFIVILVLGVNSELCPLCVCCSFANSHSCSVMAV